MQTTADLNEIAGSQRSGAAQQLTLPALWPSVAWLALLFTAAAILARLLEGPRFDGILVAAAGAAAVALALRLKAPSFTAAGRALPAAHRLGSATPKPAAQSLSAILLDTITDGVCAVDRRGRIVFANPATTRLLGADTASLIGRPVHDLLHGLAPASLRCGEDCPLHRAADRNQAAAGEDTFFRAGGESFTAEYVLTPLPEQSHFSGSVLSFRDISRRDALDRLKDEFISTVSHELRTPLTSIRGALGLLSSGMLGEVNDKAANLLRIALTNSDRLVRLINDILDLERIQSGREPLAFRTVQLASVVRQAIEDMQPMAEAADVHLVHDTTQVEIAADADRLLQVLTNLLSNAIKFSPPGSSIAILLRPGASGVTLSVVDQGRGIPADKLETIFGRFQQVDASDARQKGGSGLGLAICRTIVIQHAGRIWAERNPVRGSTFSVFLPYRPASTGTPEPDSAQGHDEGAVLTTAGSSGGAGAASHADAQLRS